MSALVLEARGAALWMAVRVQPRASREALVGVREGVLRVALTAPPVEGEANAALVALLARELGVPRRSVTIVRGARGRTKTVVVEGIPEAELRARLEGR